jgi:hypothetical protein
MLETAPELEAKALFEHLGELAEGGLEEKVLRTFQRRVRHSRKSTVAVSACWRAESR